MPISERKRSEEALRESEECFRLAVQAAKMYAYEWDVSTDKVVRSEEYVNVLGFSQQKELTREQIVATIHPDDRALFIGSVDQLTPQNSTTQVSYRLLRPDGSVVWLEKSARGFFDEQGKLLRMIGMVANVTERNWRNRHSAKVRRNFDYFSTQLRKPFMGLISNTDARSATLRASALWDMSALTKCWARICMI